MAIGGKVGIGRREGNPKERVVVRNGKLYLGRNFAMSFSKHSNNKVTVSIDYTTAEDRIEIFKSKTKEETFY